MSLIFDQFPTMERAEAFVAEAKRRFDLGGEVFATNAEAYADDARAWVCEPPIAYIDRASDDLPIVYAVALEESVEALGVEYGGTYTGA